MNNFATFLDGLVGFFILVAFFGGHIAFESAVVALLAFILLAVGG